MMTTIRTPLAPRVTRFRTPIAALFALGIGIALLFPSWTQRESQVVIFALLGAAVVALATAARRPSQGWALLGAGLLLLFLGYGTLSMRAWPAVERFAPDPAGRSSYDLRFTEGGIGSIRGLEPTDFANAGTATGCRFTPTQVSELDFSVAVSDCGEGSVAPTLLAGSVTDDGGNGPIDPVAAAERAAD